MMQGDAAGNRVLTVHFFGCRRAVEKLASEPTTRTSYIRKHLSNGRDRVVDPNFQVWISTTASFSGGGCTPIAAYYFSPAPRKRPKLFVNLITHGVSSVDSSTSLKPPYLVHREACRMADVKDITPDLDRLDSQLDGLQDALEPLLGGLEQQASQLPLLDKAKLFSLTAYAIESLLFCESCASSSRCR